MEKVALLLGILVLIGLVVLLAQKLSSLKDKYEEQKEAVKKVEKDLISSNRQLRDCQAELIRVENQNTYYKDANSKQEKSIINLTHILEEYERNPLPYLVVAGEVEYSPALRVTNKDNTHYKAFTYQGNVDVSNLIRLVRTEELNNNFKA